MTLEQAIASYEKSAERYHKAFLRNKAHGGEFYQREAESDRICEEHERQLATWLRELQERRKAPEIIYCHACIHFQCNMRFDGSVPKCADDYECRRGCGGCDPMDYCCYGERAERRTDENNNLHV